VLGDVMLRKEEVVGECRELNTEKLYNFQLAKYS
jgi:hypothetical protein